MNPASYSFEWAKSIVTRVIEKYPRATEILCILLDLTPRQMATYLAKGDPLWPVLRSWIHLIEIYLQIHQKNGYYTAVEYFRSRYRYIYNGDQAERLAKRLEFVIMKEQGSRGGRGRSESDDPSQPLLFQEACHGQDSI